MKIKSGKITKHLRNIAEGINEAARADDERMYNEHYGALMVLESLCDGRIDYSTELFQCKYMTVKMVTFRGVVVFAEQKLGYSEKEAVINEVSQFLQDAGYEDASKAVDCEYDL